jgi:hypothetical protein
MNEVEKLFFDQEVNHLTWWSDAVDRNYWKPRNDELMLLVWWTWTWKTTFSMSLAMQNVRKWNGVLFYSFETRPAITKRNFISACFWITPDVIDEKSYTESQVNNIKEWVAKLDNELLLMRDIVDIDKENIDWKLSIEALMADIEYLRFNNKIDLVIIDNLWFLKSDCCTSWKEIDEQNSIVTELINFSKSDKVLPVMILHHFRKDQNDRNVPKGMWEIRWSQKLADWCTRLIQLFRPDRAKPVVKFIQMKDRWFWLYWTEDLTFDRGVYKKFIAPDITKLLNF